MTPLPQSARYALRAMACVASAPPGEKLPAERIARATHVPPAFLSKVLRKLVAAGLLRAERGHHGGFELNRPAEAIRFLDVLEAIGLELLDQECAFGWGSCDQSKPCPLHETWTELKQQLIVWAARHTLAEIDCGALPALRA